MEIPFVKFYTIAQDHEYWIGRNGIIYKADQKTTVRHRTCPICKNKCVFLKKGPNRFRYNLDNLIMFAFDDPDPQYLICAECWPRDGH